MLGSNSSLPAASKANTLTASKSTLGDTPLTMTVHALPLPGAPESQRRTAGRWRMLAVMFVCAAPVIASYVMFYWVRPEGRRNYGELMQPVRALPDVNALSLDGTVHNLRSLKGQWLLVSVAGGACDAACQLHVYLQRQMRESLGREKDRLDRVWLISDDAPVAAALQGQVDAKTVDAYAFRVPMAALGQWLTPAPGQQLSDHLYLVDPMGNWMMRFPANIDAGKAKRDLERLLRAAASWDRSGRESAGMP
jgi:hypothetical protein